MLSDLFSTLDIAGLFLPLFIALSCNFPTPDTKLLFPSPHPLFLPTAFYCANLFREWGHRVFTIHSTLQSPDSFSSNVEKNLGGLYGTLEYKTKKSPMKASWPVVKPQP